MPTPIVAGIGVAGTLASGYMASKASEKAARAQTEGLDNAAQAELAASREAIAEQRRQYDITRSDLLGEQAYQRAGAQPFRDAGASAVRQLSDIYGGRVDPTEAVKRTPGYQFQVDEGQKALERSAAARGGLLSGRAATASQALGQNMASGAYRGYIGDLFQLSGYGPTVSGAGGAAAGQLASAGQQAGGGIAGYIASSGMNQANLAAQRGNAMASSYANNPWGQAIGQGTSAALQYSIGTQTPTGIFR